MHNIASFLFYYLTTGIIPDFNPKPEQYIIINILSQFQNRELVERQEELETENNHLLRRFDKIKNAKSNLFKEI